jgi:hypothetical protein
VNILDEEKILGLFVIETNLKAYNRITKIPGYVYRGTKKIKKENGGILF